MVKSQYTNQILTTLTACLLPVSCGIALSWNSPAMLYLSSNKTHLEKPLTPDEVANIGACFSYGALIFGNLLSSLILYFFSFKILLHVMGCPVVIFWILVSVATDAVYLYAARLFVGWALHGMFITCPAYATDFSTPNIRPNLIACVSCSLHLGGFIGMIVNSYLAYNYQIFAFIGIPIIFLILFSFFPDTPQQLLRKQNYMKAKDSLRFYRNYKADSYELEQEFNQMKTQIEEDGQDKTRYSDLCTKEFRKGLLRACCLLSFNTTSGSFVLLNYIGLLYNKLQHPPAIGSILFLLVHIIGSTFAVLFGHRFKRRYLLMTFASIVGWIGLSIVAGLSLLIPTNKTLITNPWIIILIISITFFTLQFGVHSQTHFVINQQFTLKTKKFGILVTFFVGSLVNIFVLKGFPLILLYYHTFAALMILIVVGFFSTLFYRFFLPKPKPPPVVP